MTFARLWTAAVVSRFGDALRGAALPLLAASLTRDPMLVALVTAAGFLPWLIFGLLGGAIADRVDQRRAMWAVDAARGALMAGFALIVWLGHASIWLLLLLAFALTTLQTVFDNAATALLPTVVPKDDLGRANSRLMTGQEVAHRFIGSPLVPVLLLIGLAMPYALNAATYFIGALLIAGLPAPPPRERRTSGRTMRGDIAQGIRVLWQDKVLRWICASVILGNIGMGAIIAMIVLHVTRWIGTGNSGYAAVITAYGIGSVAGGALATKVTKALGGQTRTLLWLGAMQALCLLALGTVRTLPAAVIALALFGFGGMIWNVTEVTVMQQRSPAETLGRVSAAFRTLSTGVAPLGAVLGGVVASLWGYNAPALAAGGLLGLGVIALIPAVRAGITSEFQPA